MMAIGVDDLLVSLNDYYELLKSNLFELQFTFSRSSYDFFPEILSSRVKMDL
jgi:hypothetical protein